MQSSTKNGRVGGWDVTFSAPKDVSVLFAAADPDARRAMLEDARRAAAAALRALHEQGVFETRRGKGGAGREVSADVMAALFPQATSRAGQPQIHCHGVVINAGLRHDGTTGALHSEQLHRWKTFAGAIFRAELAAGLERRGFAVEADGQAFRVVGVSRELAEAWSSRRKQIERATAGSAEADGKTRRLAKERAALASRRAKETVPREADLDGRWRADMERLGLSPERVLRDAREAAKSHERPDMGAGQAALSEALRRRSVTTEREWRRLVAEATQTRGGGAAAAKAEADRLVSRGGLLDLGRTAAGERVFTTRAVLERERRMLLDALERRAEASPIGADAVEGAIARRPTLSDEQAAAVRHAAGKGGVVAVEGFAGAGKSFALGAFTEAARESGAEVVGLAPSWQAARVLGKDTGLPARALQGFVGELERGDTRLEQRSVVVLDEAGMASTADVAKLLAHARDTGAKVVLSGDRGQLRSVEPGASFQAIADAIGVSRMEHVRRQEIGWQREAGVAFGRGDAVDGLARYEAKGRVLFAEDAEAAVKRLGDAWEANRRKHPGADVAVLAATNDQVNALNAELRGRAMAAGELGAEAVTVRTLHAGGRKGEGVEREMEIRAGDRVAVGGVNLTRAGKDVLPNDTATVRSVAPGADPALTLRLDRTGREETMRLGELAPRRRKGDAGPPGAPRIQHAYARTVHKAQGGTHDFVLVHAGAGLDSARAYVAATRHRRDALIVADAGAIRERLAADGKETDGEAVRTAFLGAARASRDGHNAADHVADRAAWLRTGDHRAVSDAPRMSRVRYAMERAKATAIQIRRAVVERARSVQRERSAGHERTVGVAAARTVSRDRGISRER